MKKFVGEDLTNQELEECIRSILMERERLKLADDQHEVSVEILDVEIEELGPTTLLVNYGFCWSHHSPTDYDEDEEDMDEMENNDTESIEVEYKNGIISIEE